MADFIQHFHSLRPSQQHFSEMDMNMEMLKQFAELKPNMLDHFNIHNFSVETLSATHQLQPQFPTNFSTHNNNLSSNFHSITSNEDVLFESKRREETEQYSTSISKNNISSSSASASTSEFEGGTTKKRKNRVGKGKRRRRDEQDNGKSEEFIHVRAKRGQATDSHSIAERVRREKINKKMRCLQDLVPGCHKTMGMAGMLEEIINYVHSLQNQVEFLSMELATACSSSYTMNLETESNKKAQAQGTNSHEAMEMEKWAREQYGPQYSCFHSTWSL